MRHWVSTRLRPATCFDGAALLIRSGAVKSLKAQFVLMYAVAGAVAQLLPLFLERERGMTKTEVGHAMALANTAVFLAPAICAWIADAHLSTRRNLALIYAILFIVIGALTRAHAVVWLMTLAAAQRCSSLPSFRCKRVSYLPVITENSAATSNGANGARFRAYHPAARRSRSMKITPPPSADGVRLRIG